MKEKILEAFARLGFCLEKSDDVGYEFEYEGMTLLYLCNEDDEDFLTIALPGFYEYDEENVATYCALSEKINASLKYVKAFTPGHSMWLCYERELFGGEDLEALISRMIAHLEAGVVFSSKAVKAIEEQFADSERYERGLRGTDGRQRIITGGHSYGQKINGHQRAGRHGLPAAGG